jgi:hypothetical protein
MGNIGSTEAEGVFRLLARITGVVVHLQHEQIFATNVTRTYMLFFSMQRGQGRPSGCG